MLDLVCDEAVRGFGPTWRRQLRTEVTRMIRAAARSEDRADLDVALRLTDDAEIRALNRDYRRKDKATDVLAFAQREGLATPGMAGVDGDVLLGDIVVSVETARRQAKRKSPAGLYHEVRFLVAHGLCHLLGYDHNDDAEEAEMNARMQRLLDEAMRRGRIRAA